MEKNDELGVKGTLAPKCGCWVVFLFVIFTLAVALVSTPSPGF